MTGRLSLLVVSLALVVSAFGQAGPGRKPRGGGPEIKELHPLMRQVVNAQRVLKFAGVRRTTIRLGTETRTDTERVWKSGMQTRIEFAASSPNAGQVIVTDGRRQWHYFPQTNEIQVKEVAPENSIMRLARLGSGREFGYRWVESAGEEVAGRATKQLSLTDRNGNSISSIWVDPANGMVLKRANFDPSGRLVGKFEYDSVDYSPKIDASDFVINRKGATVITIEEVLSKSAKAAGLPAYGLPRQRGFYLDLVRTIQIGSEKALISTYVGERGRLTLVVSRTEIRRERLEGLAHGRVSYADRKLGGANIVLISELPERMLVNLVNTIEVIRSRND